MHHVSYYFRYITYNYCSLFCNDCVLQLFVKRMKLATDAEKEVLHKLDANFMSDEEDGEDDQSGLWIVRSPAWRSRRLTSLINSLQQRVEAKSTSSHPSNPRVQGEPSARQPPSSSPTWAVQIIREPEASREIPEDPPSPQPPSPYFSPMRGNDDDGDDHGEDDWMRTPISRRRHRQLLDWVVISIFCFLNLFEKKMTVLDKRFRFLQCYIFFHNYLWTLLSFSFNFYWEKYKNYQTV